MLGSLLNCKSEALAQDKEDKFKFTGRSSREGVSANFKSERTCNYMCEHNVHTSHKGGESHEFIFKCF